MAGFGTARAASDTPAADANPYSVISDRNIFHLNPPPPPPAADAPKPVDLPKVALTGFVGKGDSIRVLLAIPPAKDSKDGFTYLTLAPGDRDHDVQLVKIHPEVAEVEILNGGTLQTLSKSNNLASLGPVPHPAAGGGPGMPEKPGMHRPMIPGFNPPGAPPAPGLGAAPQGGGGSSLVIGGRDSEQSYGGSSSGAIVSGGGSGGGSPLFAGGGGGGGGQAYVGGGTSAAQYNNAAGNNAAASQIANALFNPTTPRAPTQVAPAVILPPEVQGPKMAIEKATIGGPPLPPILQEQLDAAMGQGPPPVPNE
jgi:hypothetical protein